MIAHRAPTPTCAWTAGTRKSQKDQRQEAGDRLVRTEESAVAQAQVAVARQQMRAPIESGVSRQHAVHASADGQELRQLEVPRPARGRACCTMSRTAATKSGRCAPAPSASWTCYTISKLCDIADQYGEGHVRFTIRSNIEFMVSKWEKVGPADPGLRTTRAFPVGGTGNSVTMIAHTQGWLHCDIPGTDASGVVKSLMDELYDEFMQRGDAQPRAHLPPPAARSTAAARPTSRSSSSTPSRRRSTTTSSPTSASVRRWSRAARWRRSARRW